MAVQPYARLCIGIGLILVLSYTSAVVADEVEPNFDLKLTSGDVQELVKQRAALGERLIKLVSNERAPASDRIAAAQLLAKMDYNPAISVLVRYVDLMPRASEAMSPPIAGALAEFGEAAVPIILDAYLAHDNPNGLEIDRRELALLFALQGPMAARARTYIKGLAVSGLSSETDLKLTLKIHNILDYLDN